MERPTTSDRFKKNPIKPKQVVDVLPKEPEPQMEPESVTEKAKWETYKPGTKKTTKKGK